MRTLDLASGPEWAPFIERYRRGEWRALVLHDMVLTDVTRLSPAGGLTLLDIGCGGGFDGDVGLQASLARRAQTFIGVEPDPEAQMAKVFTHTYRCPFEAAPLPRESVDLAFAFMVLEHLAAPQAFWDQLHTVLRPGSVFWGFTIDRRHWFATASLLFKRLHLKERYLNSMHGARGTTRYENYEVFYRSNTPQAVRGLGRAFSETTVLNFQTVGELAYYLPRPLRWVGLGYDHAASRFGLPGSLLVVRAVK